MKNKIISRTIKHLLVALLIVFSTCSRPIKSETASNDTLSPPSKPIRYEAGANDLAEIKLTLNPDQTLQFYFRPIPQYDSIVSQPKTVAAFESIGIWRTVGNQIEVTFYMNSKPFKYKPIFDDIQNSNVIINDSTFRFDKEKEFLILSEIVSPKN